MGKGVRISLVCLEFMACVAGGYFIGEMFLPDIVITKVDVSAEAMPVEQAPVEEVVVLSPVPVLLEEGISKPVLGKDGKYSFDVVATVESRDTLAYILYADAECEKMVTVNEDGKFAGVPPTLSQTYYVCAMNISTGDYSDLIELKGFVQPQPQIQKVQKITESELHNIFQNGIMAVDKGFNRRLAGGFKIIVTNARPGDNIPDRPQDVYGKLLNQMWKSVSIAEPLKYDEENKLTRLVLTVVYPD